MIVCPACSQEVHSSQEHIELRFHKTLGTSLFDRGLLAGATSLKFHSKECLKKWLDQQVMLPAK